MNKSKVYSVLNELSIEFEEYNHPAVYTVEQAEEHWKNIEATHCKNLFFRDKKGRRHFLIILRHDKQLDIKGLENRIGAGRISFASEQRLSDHMGLTPGSVSPFGLINNTENDVEVYIDDELKLADKVGFHPNDNSITITISAEDFVNYLKWTGNPFQFIEV